MTRKSKREIERAVERMGVEQADDPVDVWIGYRTSEGWVDADGEPPNDPDASIRYAGIVVERAEAEAEGWEILDTIDTPGETEHVRVPWDYGDREGPA
jgi:hypothetical protein